MDYKDKIREILLNDKTIPEEERKKLEEILQSKDDKIKEELISFLQLPHPQFVGERKQEEWIAWLEKQSDNLVENGYTNNKDIIKYADKYSHEIWHKLMDNFKNIKDYYIGCNDVSDIVLNAIIDTYNWLEKQGKETSWKPSKEEMDVLYGLAYITNQYDEHKEEVITRLYQDLKREFFNGSSYENMFPNTEDGVRRRSTIQVLEYARSLDTYNQYGKADIDKNIAWLENQAEEKEYTFKSIPRLLDMIEPTDRAKAYCQKLIDTLTREGYNIDAKIVEEVLKWWNGEDVPMAVMDEQKPVNDTVKDTSILDKVEPKYKPKFHEGDWAISNLDGKARQISEVHFDEYNSYYVVNGKSVNLEEYDRLHRLWTIQDDAKYGDILVHNGCTFIFMGIKDGIVQAIEENMLELTFFGEPDKDNDYHPATKEQRELFFQKMKEAGYTWDAECKQPMKIEDVCMYSTDNYTDEERKTICEGCEIKCKYNPTNNTFSSLREEDERMFRSLHNLIYVVRDCDCDDSKRKELSDWLESLKNRVQPKQKQELDKEDEKCIRLSTDIIDSALRAGFCVQLDRDRCIDWLKSIKQRATWKPSKEQMEALEILIINIIRNPLLLDNYTQSNISSLCNDLKKL